ncbi:ribosomal protein S18-alanine N-acetyltransferase [Corynebacterium sp. L4756]|uniref:ribosomal protein S18-alanine N-acetyltransferase n=1 Tax=unclassified Corynebacterium TaxID=2624378 RepID=UPI00374CFDF0
MHLRELTQADAQRCAELEELLFPGETPWSKAIFESEFQQPYNFYLGVEDECQLVGYAGIGMRGTLDYPEFEILTIGTDPKQQHRGIGRMMMDNICHIADLKHAPIFLEVRVGNDPAIEMYQAYGFKHLGIRRNYYQPSGADAHTMKRDIQTEKP